MLRERTSVLLGEGRGITGLDERPGVTPSLLDFRPKLIKLLFERLRRALNKENATERVAFRKGCEQLGVVWSAVGPRESERACVRGTKLLREVIESGGDPTSTKA